MSFYVVLDLECYIMSYAFGDYNNILKISETGLLV